MTEPTYAEASRALLRERLFGAAAELLSDRPWSDITMADVAAGAGVSRQTLYNEFGSRDEFAQAFLLREADQLVDAVAGALAAHPGQAREALEAAFGVFLESAAEDPLIRTIASSDGADGLLPLITTRGGPLLGRASERLATVLEASWAQLASGEATLVSEALVRLAISHAALPTADPGLAAKRMAEILGPYVEGLLEARPAAA
jgi:AcrR family transcriptional regulator